MLFEAENASQCRRWIQWVIRRDLQRFCRGFLSARGQANHGLETRPENMRTGSAVELTICTAEIGQDGPLA